jgi:hypothetical protein
LTLGFTEPARHHSLYKRGVIVFTLDPPRIHRTFSIKSASFNKSS